MLKETQISFMARVVMVILITITTASASEEVDDRTAIDLNASERNLVLGEMRNFLAAVQQIVEGISSQNMKVVSLNAQKLGLAAAKNVPETLTKKLPIGFKRLAFDTHLKFDEIARDAEDLEDSEHTLTQVATLMKNCVSCHAIYKFELSK